MKKKIFTLFIILTTSVLSLSGIGSKSSRINPCEGACAEKLDMCLTLCGYGSQECLNTCWFGYMGCLVGCMAQ